MASPHVSDAIARTTAHINGEMYNKGPVEQNSPEEAEKEKMEDTEDDEISGDEEAEEARKRGRKHLLQQTAAPVLENWCQKECPQMRMLSSKACNSRRGNRHGLLSKQVMLSLTKKVNAQF